MKIIELRASNFARLRAVEIRPDGHLVPITGANSQGKSSVLRSIWTALVGRAVAPPEPIRLGAEKAVIKLDLGALSIVRTFKRTKHDDVTSDLVITDVDGGRVTRKPQELIDGLLGDLSFDPLAFARSKPADQLAVLKGLVRGFDFDKAARERLRLFVERTDANRLAKASQTRALGIQLPAGPVPAPIDTAALMAQLNSANQTNATRQRQLSESQRMVDEAGRQLDEAERLRARASALEISAAALMKSAGEVGARAPAEVDVSEITAALGSAERVLGVRNLHEERRRHEADAEAQAQESQRLTEAIEALDADAQEAVEMAKLPAGLSLTSDGVLLNGHPFEVAGTAEKIVASVNVGMTLNPDLRVMLIDEGSELDSKALALLASLAEERDFQIWYCRVEEGEKGAGFRIEDGSNVGQRGAVAAE